MGPDTKRASVYAHNTPDVMPKVCDADSAVTSFTITSSAEMTAQPPVREQK